jgi:SAM-dependent methyltransferase
MAFTDGIKRWIKLQNPKFAFLHNLAGNKTFNLLDIGSGNHSASKTVTLFPGCQYYGVDLDKNYNNDERDFKVMKVFYEMDLTALNFSAIPPNTFDAILIAHVIEHLHNGDKVLEGLIPKLKPGGEMYVEYPGKRSTKLPSMKGTLNFKDDPTHVRLYSIPELSALFTSNGCTIVNAGYRRSWFYIFAIPLRVILAWLKGKAVNANVFWDLLGFAEYVRVRRSL